MRETLPLPLFDNPAEERNPIYDLGPGTAILQGFALASSAQLLDEISGIAARSPFRHMVTPGGFRMSVAMTNCGCLGWVTDRKGYRYDPIDPDTHAPWPPMPPLFLDLAERAAAAAGLPGFPPDACLINRYQPGARLTLHQDKNERRFDTPIVSISLGLPATFLFGGDERSDKTTRIPVAHGDVLVWGGPARLRYHGIMPLKPGSHPIAGEHRYNLTLRKAG
jgi:alkylated DNA repair protein (DNA oxidative demethylase)